MRSLALMAVAAVTSLHGARTARADTGPPLLSLEARAGYGLAFGGGAGGSVQRLSPLTWTFLVDYAIIDEPWVSTFGGVVAEGNGHGSAGAVIGARVRPGRGRLRVAGGAEALLFPSTLFGPLASVGMCVPIIHLMNVCADAEATLFVAGGDLPDQRIAGQAQLVVGIAFDAW